jgi:hypothetical protein
LQFGIGDLEVPNPAESAFVVAAGGQSATSILNLPAAVASWQPGLASTQDPAVPGLPILPHRALSNPTIYSAGNEAELAVALALQQQAADFFTSNGQMSDPGRYLNSAAAILGLSAPPGVLFANEPDSASLPTRLNFLQIPE